MLNIPPKDFTTGIVAENAAARVTALDPVARFSLRAHKGDREAVGSALGLDLPMRVGQVAGEEMRALCIGPDEWLVHLPEAAADRVREVRIDAPHSLTEITDRELSFRIDGPRATELLTLGWPRDPASIAVGEGRRTVFDGASVILWRDGEEDWRMDIWRSFAPHVVSLLVTGCTELAAG
ncbi:sarcosine oxidase subunit gamma [Palleronia sp. LCG004]|uniref:sarcosine oxidase subunit gamma n=1 Tax=Palleronia sp. LCG004 TaxID=3079304 RepID=UPI0029421C2F|nr:sarcosine oxidase subunit gamma family protein [Palleronia sp. LCG004]WOI56700.1 sarcosine oxidase subunit gamma family protein [Palleronia sp. LCG004]